MNDNIPKIELFETSLKPVDKKIFLINKNLPSTKNGSFRYCLIGSSGSGKTSLIKNILFNKAWGYCKYFDEIYCFIGSEDDRREFDLLSKAYRMDDKILISSVFDENEVRKLYDDIEQDNNKGKGLNRVLMIFDDMICENLCKRDGGSGMINRIFIKGRHANISCVISSQKYHLLPNNIRLLNCSHLTVFSSTNSHDLKSIADEHCNMLSPDEMLRKMKDNLQSRYDFITIDYSRNPNDRLLTKEFLPVK